MSNEADDVRVRPGLVQALEDRRLLHAARSGRHAWRQFTSQYFALAEDRLRQSARATIPAHLRGRGRVLRAGFKKKHQRYMEG